MVAQFIINEASADDQRKIVSQLELETSEKLCALLPPEETAALLEELPADIAADVVEEMNADVGGHLLRALNEEDSEAILAEIDDRKESEDLRERVGFDEDCADSLMSDQVFAFPTTATISDVLADLQKNAEDYIDAVVQYFFVVDHDKHLRGVLSMRSLLLGRTVITDRATHDR